ncbi:hypothetical protein E1A91_D06G008000v1 [Gossypium mustelinum]|uniref:Homeobox domain-containing protein n=1 Tax=Gossypium mustelinum TaxID=34275 RepID=A0A5D2UFM3_GOSMU|nr:hypothetical protein E1A91_D06G008000v1 [Gossypium mustelinum]
MESRQTPNRTSRMLHHFDAYNTEISHTRHLMDLLGAPNDSYRHHRTQTLSLSLGSCMLGSSFPGAEDSGDDYPFIGHPTTYVIGNSRYLIPAQSLLNELVNVGFKNIDETPKLSSEFFRSKIVPSPDKHELHITLTKLIGLLEEVEAQYEKYNNRMEQVVSLFESIVGVGAARCYTALTLQAMCRHFGKLRDTILTRINRIRTKVRHDFMHSNTLCVQRQVWRPVRGLPQTSVAILRSWLFQHFLHPYPTDSVKLMLSSQTGLTKNQVSNWFINARVRLWKPMIEEIYKEEFADSPQHVSHDLIEG